MQEWIAEEMPIAESKLKLHDCKTNADVFSI